MLYFMKQPWRGLVEQAALIPCKCKRMVKEGAYFYYGYELIYVYIMDVNPGCWVVARIME